MPANRHITFFFSIFMFVALYALFLLINYQQVYQHGTKGLFEGTPPAKKHSIHPLYEAIVSNLQEKNWNRASLNNLELLFPLPPKITENNYATFQKSTATVYDDSVPWQFLASVTQYSGAFALPSDGELLKEAFKFRVEGLELVNFDLIAKEQSSHYLPNLAHLNSGFAFSGETTDVELIGYIGKEGAILIEIYVFISKQDTQHSGQDASSLLLRVLNKMGEPLRSNATSPTLQNNTPQVLSK